MSAWDTISARLAAGDVIVLDGGMGTELQARGVHLGESWSGGANLLAPDVVRAVHEDSIRAGADVIITNTYASARPALERDGLGDRFEEANRRAVEAALSARAQVADRPVAVAGSISSVPSRDVMHRGRPGLAGDPLLACYREQASLLADAGVDLIALEMMTAPVHAEPALAAARETGLPIWFGVSVTPPGPDGMRTLNRPDWDLDDLLAASLDRDLAAVAVMHSVLEAVEPALAAIRGRWDGPLGAYPHAGEYRPPEWVFADISPEDFAAAASGWVDRGARLVGGCCGIRPGHIAAVRAALS